MQHTRREVPVRLYRIKDASEPAVIERAIVKLAP